MAPLWQLLPEESAEYRRFDDHFTDDVRPSHLAASLLQALSGEYRSALIASLVRNDCGVWPNEGSGPEYMIGVSRQGRDLREFFEKKVPLNHVAWSAWYPTICDDDWVPRVIAAKPTRRGSDASLITGYSDCLLMEEARGAIAASVFRLMIAEIAWAFQLEDKITFRRPDSVLHALCRLPSIELRKYIILYI